MLDFFVAQLGKNYCCDGGIDRNRAFSQNEKKTSKKYLLEMLERLSFDEYLKIHYRTRIQEL